MFITEYRSVALVFAQFHIASSSFCGLGSADNPHSIMLIDKLNCLVSPPDGISVESGFPNPTENLVSEVG